MSYYRASTGNPLGWRNPGTVTLGNMMLHAGPDWKTVAAQHDAAIRAGQQIKQARQRAANHRMHQVDAAARGDRVRVRMPRLSGLGSLDPSSQMVRGATYVFHFTCAIGFGIGCPSLDAVRSALLTDSNFRNPAPLLEGNGGMAISFQYNGQGSNILQAAGEMSSVIQSNVFGYARFVFVSADGPAVSPAATVVSANPDGTVTLSDGSTLNTATGIVTSSDGTTTATTITTPAGSSGSGFDLTSLLGGIGIGGAVALALGGVLLLKSL